MGQQAHCCGHVQMAGIFCQQGQVFVSLTDGHKVRVKVKGRVCSEVLTGVHHEPLHRDIYPGFNVTGLYLAFQLKSHIHLTIFPHFSNLFSYIFTECTILSPSSSLPLCSVLSIALIFAGCFKLSLCSNFSWITVSFILSPRFYLISLSFPTTYFCL